MVTAISVPPRLKKRGRPKGHDLTVIGLPAKKRNTFVSKLQPFAKLHTSIKEKGKTLKTFLQSQSSLVLIFFDTVLLKWLVGEDVTAGILKCPKNLIEEEQVEVKPELVLVGILDENVDVHLIKGFFHRRCMVGGIGCYPTKGKQPRVYM